MGTEAGEVPVEVATARILRRWAKANGKHRKLRLTVPDARHENDEGIQMIQKNRGVPGVHSMLTIVRWLSPSLSRPHSPVHVTLRPGISTRIR